VYVLKKGGRRATAPSLLATCPASSTSAPPDVEPGRSTPFTADDGTTSNGDAGDRNQNDAELDLPSAIGAGHALRHSRRLGPHHAVPVLSPSQIVGLSCDLSVWGVAPNAYPLAKTQPFYGQCSWQTPVRS